MKIKKWLKWFFKWGIWGLKGFSDEEIELFNKRGNAALDVIIWYNKEEKLGKEIYDEIMHFPSKAVPSPEEFKYYREAILGRMRVREW